MGQLIPIAIALAGTAAQQAETQRVERKQDQETAQGLLSQSRRQQEADRRVNDEIAQLETSTADAARNDRLGQYMQQLQRSRKQAVAGLESPIGGQAFQADSTAARAGSDSAAARTADLMARIEAPRLQRQDEAFDYGRLATDIDGLSREAAGQSFIDQMRLRNIRRRPGMDLLSGGLMAAGGAMAGGGAGAAAAPNAMASFGNNTDALYEMPGARPRYGYGIPRGSVLGY
ncbi:hypothetical protein [Stenotrophomonas maltophilia]|uniref:hypothetical protein n=1 Tax=Stenotrophomonas maltophilia TaxID=40324 RepID=UPI0002B8BF36|nr:hypothetical protein [Stenotrophomonas maltophilia]EMF58889.1 Hypothetical protein EPM1_4159 [Stenotrophomonas maltophilia EPM1]KWV45087.1 hypothetical protein AS591_20490 [Stenotrophomonas maltophilia]